MASYLQGRVVKVAACTVRLYVLDGSWSTRDADFTDGQSFASVDAVCDFLATEWSPATVTISEETGKITITVAGTQIKLAWSHSGAGVDLRNFLGEAADVTSSTPSP